jgi:uncharacterized membrane protein
VKLSYLWRGVPGHPLHPPLTDATIGAYTFATFAAFLDVTGISNSTAAHAWWIALLFGLFTTTFTALTGLFDWLTITPGTPLKRTATTHALTMVSATVLFGIAALFGHDDWKAGNVSAGEFILTLVGFALLTLGGTFGGSITYVHGMRVLNLVDEPAARALRPTPDPEKEQAESS